MYQSAQLQIGHDSNIYNLLSLIVQLKKKLITNSTKWDMHAKVNLLIKLIWDFNGSHTCE